MKPSWGLIVAMGMVLVAIFMVRASTNPYIEQFKGRAFAMRQAEAKGFGDWALISESEIGAGELRFVFKSPVDSRKTKDFRVKLVDGSWGVTMLSEVRFE